MAREEEAPRGPGRPRDPATHAAVLAATRRLVGEQGYAAVTVNAIAAAASVVKQTLYRRWPGGKAEIVLDAYLDRAVLWSASSYDGLEPTLRRFLAEGFARLAEDGGMVRELIASAQGDAAFMAQFRERYAVPRMNEVRRLLRKAVATGELPLDADVATLSDMIHGAFWYRLLIGEPLDEAFAARLARAVAVR